METSLKQLGNRKSWTRGTRKNEVSKNCIELYCLGKGLFVSVWFSGSSSNGSAYVSNCCGAQPMEEGIREVDTVAITLIL